MPYYAVFKGITPGIFNTWTECSESVTGFPGAKYKKFDTKQEADLFMQGEDDPVPKTHPKLVVDHVDYYVYTDGACVNNGKPNAMSGIGIFFGKDDSRNVSSTIEGKQTNNTAELTAILNTYSIIRSDVNSGKIVVIVTDSEYAIKCVTTTGDKCHTDNWKKNMPNKELVQQVYNTYRQLDNVKFMYIRAHTNKNDVHSIGNDGADKLANLAIGLTSCPYEKSEKIYLNVSFQQKENVKSLGGRWDSAKKQWYIYENNPHKNEILNQYKRI